MAEIYDDYYGVYVDPMADFDTEELQEMIAKSTLLQQGISNPTKEQLQTAKMVVESLWEDLDAETYIDCNKEDFSTEFEAKAKEIKDLQDDEASIHASIDSWYNSTRL